MDGVIPSTDTYLSLFLDIPNLNPLTVLAVVFLMMGRLIPIIILAPFLGGKNLPGPLKIMFSLSLIAILLPHVLLMMQNQPIVGLTWHFGFYFIKEIFIGAIIGILVSAPFFIAQSSGSLIDHMRGSSSLQITDPSTQTQTSPVGILYNMALIAVYYAVGGPFLFIDGVAESFQILPINQFINPVFFSLDLPFWQLTMGLMNKILSIAIRLAAPPLIGILMAEMFLGIANRLAPQVQIVFLGIPLKSWIGLGLLAFAWGLILMQLSKESLSWTTEITQTLQGIPVTKS